MRSFWREVLIRVVGTAEDLSDLTVARSDADVAGCDRSGIVVGRWDNFGNEGRFPWPS